MNFYCELPTRIPTIISIDLEVITTGYRKNLDIFFKPSHHCTEEEKDILNKASNSFEQKKIYDSMGYLKTFLHEGCIFGLNYAYDEYCKVNSIKSLSVVVETIKYNHSATHEYAAYVCIKSLWSILDFKPQKEIIYYINFKKNNSIARFYFPNANVFPIGKITKNEIRKLLMKAENDKDYQELSELLSIQFDKNEKDYFSNIISKKDLEETKFYIDEKEITINNLLLEELGIRIVE